ncbi:MAG: hypothetical protein R2750_09030 [Bacteroidales bacterium]
MTTDIYIEALLLEKKGDWDASHRLIQQFNTLEASWIHAYLHRVEGDLGNASYWYSRAGKPMHKGSLKDEWKELYKYMSSKNAN